MLYPRSFEESVQDIYRFLVSYSRMYKKLVHTVVEAYWVVVLEDRKKHVAKIINYETVSRAYELYKKHLSNKPCSRI